MKRIIAASALAICWTHHAQAIDVSADVSVGGVSAGADVSAGSGGVNAGGGVSAGDTSAGGSASVSGGSGGASASGSAGASVGGSEAGASAGASVSGGSSSASDGSSSSSSTSVGGDDTGSSTEAQSTQDQPDARPRTLFRALFSERPTSPNGIELPCGLRPCGGGEGDAAGLLDGEASDEPLVGDEVVPEPVIAACRATAATSAQPYGMVDISVASDGNPQRLGEGYQAPLEMRIAYETDSGFQVRQAPVWCVVGGDGVVENIVDRSAES